MRVFRSMVIGMLLALVGMGAGGYVYINQAGGLRQFLETELTILAGAGAVTVGEAHLGLAMTGQPLAVTAKDIVIDLDQSRLNLPDVELQFGLVSVFSGRPEAVILRGVQLDLVRQKQGWSGSAELFISGAGRGTVCRPIRRVAEKPACRHQKSCCRNRPVCHCVTLMAPARELF